MTTIIGVQLENRIFTSIDFQKVLTEFGCDIRTRLGLHEINDNVCPNNGIIILEVLRKSDEIAEKLSAFGKVQMMKF